MHSLPGLGSHSRGHHILYTHTHHSTTGRYDTEWCNDIKFCMQQCKFCEQCVEHLPHGMAGCFDATIRQNKVRWADERKNLTTPFWRVGNNKLVQNSWIQTNPDSYPTIMKMGSKLHLSDFQYVLFNHLPVSALSWGAFPIAVGVADIGRSRAHPGMHPHHESFCIGNQTQKPSQAHYELCDRVLNNRRSYLVWAETYRQTVYAECRALSFLPKRTHICM
jgi:hypothetical protein